MRNPVAAPGGARVRVRVRVGVGVGLAAAGWAIAARAAIGHVVAQVRNLPSPSWLWIATAVVAAGTGYWCSALALRAATGRRLPLGHTVAVQLAAATANRLTPGSLGGAAVNARFLATQRLSAGQTGAAISLTGLAHIAVAAAGLVVVSPTLSSLPLLRPVTAIRVAGVPVILAAIPAVATLCWRATRRALTRASPDGRLVTTLRDLRVSLADAATRPGRLVALLAATAAVKATSLLALLATTWAFDNDIADWRVVVVYLVAGPAAEAIPTPGGLGTVDAVLIAGLTHVSGGGAVGAAVAAVVVFRLLTFWAPILPGAVASGALHRRYAA
ncbi:MAG: lysylphosphatidylglycerol synthase transmembrane domain-containing protein [Trebonia sp.]